MMPNQEEEAPGHDELFHFLKEQERITKSEFVQAVQSQTGVVEPV